MRVVRISNFAKDFGTLEVLSRVLSVLIEDNLVVSYGLKVEFLSVDFTFIEISRSCDSLLKIST